MFDAMALSPVFSFDHSAQLPTGSKVYPAFAVSGITNAGGAFATPTRQAHPVAFRWEQFLYGVPFVVPRGQLCRGELKPEMLDTSPYDAGKRCALELGKKRYSGR